MEPSKKYWIDGNGQARAAERGHLAAVLEHPEHFGRTREELEATFRRCDEPLGAEGIARTVIIWQLLQAGWIQGAYDPEKEKWTLTLRDGYRRQGLAVVDRFVAGSLETGTSRPDTRLELRSAEWGRSFTPPGMAEPPPLTFERWQRVSETPLERVSIDHDGQTVTGEITFRSGSDISVRITRPYRLLESGVHIPYFARHIRDYMTPYGDQTARKLLRELYDRGRLIETSWDDLLGLLADFRSRRTDLAERMPLAADREAYLLHRRALRADRQSGKLDGPAFGREIHRMKKDLITFRVTHDREWYETLGRRLSTLWVDGGDYLIDILEGREALRA